MTARPLRFEFEGEQAVRLRVATQKRDLDTLATQLDEALRLDTRTGLLRRTTRCGRYRGSYSLCSPTYWKSTAARLAGC